MENLTNAESEALTLFYNRFYDLYDEITNDEFKNYLQNIKYYKLRETFSVYNEICKYKPIKAYLSWLKNGGTLVFTRYCCG